MPEIVRATCPECKRPLRVPIELLDKRVRCKHCHAIIRPKRDELPAAPAPPQLQPVTSKATPPPSPPTDADPIIRLAPGSKRSPIVIWLRRGVTLSLLAVAVLLAVFNREHINSGESCHGVGTDKQGC